MGVCFAVRQLPSRASIWREFARPRRVAAHRVSRSVSACSGSALRCADIGRPRRCGRPERYASRGRCKQRWRDRLGRRKQQQRSEDLCGGDRWHRGVHSGNRWRRAVLRRCRWVDCSWRRRLEPLGRRRLRRIRTASTGQPWRRRQRHRHLPSAPTPCTRMTSLLTTAFPATGSPSASDRAGIRPMPRKGASNFLPTARN